MEVRTELNSYQRELLMRLYRSRLNEEVFPVSFDMRGVGEGLIACGLIVAADGFYRFTERGLEVWKAYGDNLNATYEYHSKLSQERRKQQKMAEKKQVELSDWEKQAMENLTPKKVDALQALYEAGADTVWVEVDIHHATRDALVRYGYIEWDSKTNKYWLLDAGVQKLAEYPSSNNGALPKPEALPNVQSRVKPFHDGAGLDNEDSQIDPTPTLPVDGEGEKRVWLGAGCLACNGTGYTNGIYGAPVCSECGGTGDNPNLRHDCGDDCEECVYREVVALLSDKYPEVGELAAAMRTKKKVLARLKLGG